MRYAIKPNCDVGYRYGEETHCQFRNVLPTIRTTPLVRLALPPIAGLVIDAGVSTTPHIYIYLYTIFATSGYVPLTTEWLSFAVCFRSNEILAGCDTALQFRGGLMLSATGNHTVLRLRLPHTYIGSLIIDTAISG